MRYKVIPEVRAKRLRARFITEFVDTASGNYRSYCDESNEYVRHFLWDSLRDYSLEKPCGTQEQAAEYLALARKHDLHITGGSDFHGERNKPDHPLAAWGLDLDWLI